MVLGKDDGFEYPASHKFGHLPGERILRTTPAQEERRVLEGLHRSGNWVDVLTLHDSDKTPDVLRALVSKVQPMPDRVVIDFRRFDAWRITPKSQFTLKRRI